MRVFTTAVMMTLLFLLAGCTPSLHPLYTEKDVVFEPALIGTWVDPRQKDNEESWAFQKSGDNAYIAIEREQKNRTEEEYEFHLLRLGNYLFFDAVLRKSRVDGKEADVSSLVRPHWFGRISIQGDSMRCAMLAEDWLEHAVAKNKVHVQHEELEQGMLADGTILLTASTKKLQSLALKYADDKEAFPWESELTRKK